VFGSCATSCSLQFSDLCSQFLCHADFQVRDNDAGSRGAICCGGTSFVPPDLQGFWRLARTSPRFARSLVQLFMQFLDFWVRTHVDETSRLASLSCVLAMPSGGPKRGTLLVAHLAEAFLIVHSPFCFSPSGLRDGPQPAACLVVNSFAVLSSQRAAFIFVMHFQRIP